MEPVRVLAIPLLFVLAAASPAADDDPPVPMTGPMPEWMLLYKVEPVYPPRAVQHRIQGTVRFTAVIGKDGRIEELRLVSGHPLLAPAARVAVRQWIYRPTLIGDKPVRIVTQIDVPFRLGPYGAPPPQKRPDREGQTRT